jgi:ATP-dependent Clp protease ATP-binding subunit ClpC
MVRIVDLQMEDVKERLLEQGLSVEISPEAREWLAKEGYDPAFGARPLKRALQKFVESPLSKSLLAGEFSSGDTIQVEMDAENDCLLFNAEGEPIPADRLDQVEIDAG